MSNRREELQAKRIKEGKEDDFARLINRRRIILTGLAPVARRSRAFKNRGRTRERTGRWRVNGKLFTFTRSWMAISVFLPIIFGLYAAILYNLKRENALMIALLLYYFFPFFVLLSFDKLKVSPPLPAHSDTPRERREIPPWTWKREEK